MLLLTQSVFCLAQNNQIETDSIAPDKELPELSIFLESAMNNSPLLKMSDKQISQVLEQIKIEKKSWSDNISLDANAKYGLYNTLTVNDLSTNTINDTGIQSKGEQLNYYFGITFKMPISNIITKKNKLKILTENIGEKQLQKEELKSQLQQLIVTEYYNLAFLSKSLKINQDILQALTISLMKAERDIQSGLVSLENYNGMVASKGKAEESFYKVKSEYFTQYKKLMIICGLKF